MASSLVHLRLTGQKPDTYQATPNLPPIDGRCKSHVLMALDKHKKMFKNKKLRQQLHNDVFFVSKISGVFHHALNSVFEALTQRYTDLGEGEVMKWFSSEYLENGAWTRAELPPGFPNDTNTLEASNKTLKEQCTDYTMKPVLAFLSDMFNYVQDKSQLNAEFAYDAPPSTPQTKLAKDATAVLSSVQLFKGVEIRYDILTSGTHLTSMLLIIGVKPDLAAPPVAFISDATYVDMLRALDTNDKEAWTTEVDRRLAPFVGLATGDASSSSGRGARAPSWGAVTAALDAGILLVPLEGGNFFCTCGDYQHRGVCKHALAYKVMNNPTALTGATDDRPVASNRGPSRRHARRGGARDNDTLTNPPRPAPKFAFLGAPRDAPRDTA